MLKPLLVGTEDPLPADESLEVLGELPLKGGGAEDLPQDVDLGGEPCGLSLDAVDDLEELLLVEALEVEVGLLLFLPLREVGPLEVGDRHGDALEGDLLDHDGVDDPEVVEGHGDLIAADAGIAGGVEGEEGDGHPRVVDALGDLPLPVAPGADLLVVDPDGVAALLKVGLEPVDQLTVRIMPVTEEDPLRGRRLVGEGRRPGRLELGAG